MRWTDALRCLVEQVESDTSLAQPDQLRRRLEALDRLDAFDCHDALDGPDGLDCAEVFKCRDTFNDRLGQELSGRARAIRRRLEAVNTELYQEIRCQIQRGLQPQGLLRWLASSAATEDPPRPAENAGYDYVDELVSGVFRFEEPGDEHIPRDPERVFYQPTPARHIFDLIRQAGLTSDDVFVDLGSGLGHVPMLVSIFTEARSVGIELEPSYVQRARQCAHSLRLDRVRFVQGDARDAELWGGTVFYLYTPFTGSILRTVLERLRQEAAARAIRVCCFGPCTSVVAEESWLTPRTRPDVSSVTVFCSRG